MSEVLSRNSFMEWEDKYVPIYKKPLGTKSCQLKIVIGNTECINIIFIERI